MRNEGNNTRLSLILTLTLILSGITLEGFRQTIDRPLNVQTTTSK